MARHQMDALVEGHYRAEEAGDLEAIVDGILPDAEHDVAGRPGGPLHGGGQIRAFYGDLFGELRIDRSSRFAAGTATTTSSTSRSCTPRRSGGPSGSTDAGARSRSAFCTSSTSGAGSSGARAPGSTSPPCNSSCPPRTSRAALRRARPCSPSCSGSAGRTRRAASSRTPRRGAGWGPRAALDPGRQPRRAPLVRRIPPAVQERGNPAPLAALPCIAAADVGGPRKPRRLGAAVCRGRRGSHRRGAPGGRARPHPATMTRRCGS